MVKLTIGAVLICAVFALSTASGGNLLLNPGFEDGVWNSEGDWPDHYWQWVEGGWAAWKSESLETDPSKIQHPRTGDKCIAVGGWDPGSFGSFGQSVLITEGVGYVLSAWVNTEGWGESPNGELIMGWRDNTQVDEWGNPLSLGDTIGVIDFEGVHPGEYVYFEVSGTAPAGANQADVIFRGNTQGTLLMDDASFDYDIRASNPIPPDGEGVPPDISEISWTNPVPRNPSDTITCDVWFSEDYPEYGKYEGDPNFLNYATQIVYNESVNSVALDATIVPEHYYYWRVDCYDPNLIDNPELYPAIGNVWTFNTCNVRPQVEGGMKQKGWLSGGTVDVELDATVTDDGLPAEPGTYTMLWSVDSGPGAVVFSDETVEDPVATFTAAGDYVLRLAADDGELVGEDTVKIQIYEEGYTGLLALWPLDENADDIIGGHDGMLKGDAIIDTDSQVGAGSVLDIQDSGHQTNTTWADLTYEVTVTAWMKVTNFNKDWQAIVCKGDRSYRLQRNWGTNGLNFAFDVQDPSDPDISYDVVAWGHMNVNDGKWHHVAGTYDGEEIRLYIDGVLDEASQAFELEMMKVAAHLAIGENLEYATSFNGRIDEVRIYEIGLPADRVLQEFIDDGGSNSCGQVYLASDVNEDCYTNIVDLALMAADWLKCQDVTNPLCSTE
jgi:hypothetical protein